MLPKRIFHREWLRQHRINLRKTRQVRFLNPFRPKLRRSYTPQLSNK